MQKHDIQGQCGCVTIARAQDVRVRVVKTKIGKVVIILHSVAFPPTKFVHSE